MPIWTDRWTRVKKMIMLITRRVMQKILKKQNEMIFLIIRTLTGTQEHIIYLNMKYGNRVENKGQTWYPSLSLYISISVFYNSKILSHISSLLCSVILFGLAIERSRQVESDVSIPILNFLHRSQIGSYNYLNCYMKVVYYLYTSTPGIVRIHFQTNPRTQVFRENQFYIVLYNSKTAAWCSQKSNSDCGGGICS